MGSSKLNGDKMDGLTLPDVVRELLKDPLVLGWDSRENVYEVLDGDLFELRCPSLPSIYAPKLWCWRANLPRFCSVAPSLVASMRASGCCWFKIRAGATFCGGWKGWGALLWSVGAGSDP